MDVNQVLQQCSIYKADFSEAERRLYELITFVAQNANNVQAIQNRMLTEARMFFAAQELSWTTINDMAEVTRLANAGFTLDEAKEMVKTERERLNSRGSNRTRNSNPRYKNSNAASTSTTRGSSSKPKEGSKKK